MKLKEIIRKNKKGQSLVEMALIAPILLLMFLGVVEVGWALRNFIVVQNANARPPGLPPAGVTWISAR